MNEDEPTVVPSARVPAGARAMPSGPEDGARSDDPGARWHVGMITRVYYGSGTGILRSETTGREYRFRWPFVDIRGPHPRIDGLREGMRVGFDLGHTAHGVCVTVIRVLAWQAP